MRRSSRIAVACGLVTAGAALLIWGAAFRRTEILVRQEIQPPEPPPETVPPSAFALPITSPPPAEPIIEWAPVSEPEHRLVRDVTVGGLERQESGELARTYSGRPPSLCPT